MAQTDRQYKSRFRPKSKIRYRIEHVRPASWNSDIQAVTVVQINGASKGRKRELATGVFHHFYEEVE